MNETQQKIDDGGPAMVDMPANTCDHAMHGNSYAMQMVQQASSKKTRPNLAVREALPTSANASERQEAWQERANLRGARSVGTKGNDMRGLQTDYELARRGRTLHCVDSSARSLG